MMRVLDLKQINIHALRRIVYLPCFFLSTATFSLYPYSIAAQPAKPPLHQRPPTTDEMQKDEEVPSSDRSRYEKHDYHDHRHDQDFRHYRYNEDGRYPHRYHHDYDDFDGTFESY